MEKILCNTIFALLLLFAVAGKMAAYISVGPIYIGDAVLLAASMGLVLARPRLCVRAANPTLAPIALFCGLGLLRLASGDLSSYGLLALRDSVIWGYAAYTFLLVILLPSAGRPDDWVTMNYRRFIPVYLAVGPIIVFITYYLRYRVGILDSIFPAGTVKVNDVMVHLAGIFAFTYLGLAKFPKWGIVPFVVAFSMATVNRNAIMVFLLVVVLLLVRYPPRKPAWVSVVCLSVPAFILMSFYSDAELRLPSGERPISISNIREGLVSAVWHSDNKLYDGSREWRLAWWDKIVDYTVFGEYFWTGKGFGRNLADEDGFNVSADKSLRSPHSAHMTVLARMGVPGLLMWVAVVVAVAYTMVSAHIRAARAKDSNKARLMWFLFCYFVAFTLSMSFDVVLEGPYSGIWYWAIVGTAISVGRTKRRIEVGNTGRLLGSRS
jgi:hypothetical protein